MVKHATHVRTKKQYAVKVMNIAESTSGDEDGMTIEEIADEIRLTMSLTHPQVVKIYDFYKAENHVYVVMELLKGGELLEAVISMGHYSERDAAIIMKQLFTGLVGVHAQNITHRDLKLENLILAEEGDVTSLRIADFGLAKKMKTARGKLSAQCGSPAYVAPELVTGKAYTPAVDMWATGCIMYALLCGELPFFEEDDQAMFRRISQGRMHAPSEEISAKGLDLLSKLLDVDRVKRLTAAEALEHKWITGAVSSKAALTSQKPINRSRMQRFADQKLGEDALTVRELDAGDLLIKQGARAKEVFLIKSGRCEVVVNRPDGSEAKVAERGEGEFVGEMGADVGAEAEKDIADEGDFGYNPDAKRETTRVSAFDARANALRTSPTAWVSGASAEKSAEKGRRGADVRALEDVTVAVMNAAQMRWLLDHDYGADSELTSAVVDRRRELERATRTVTFSERAPDVRTYTPTPLPAESRPR